MLKIILNFCLVFLLFCCTSKVDKESTSKSFVDKNFAAQKLDSIRILITSDNHNPPFNQYLQKNNIQKVGFVSDTQFLDPDKKFTLNAAMMDRDLQRAFPDKNAAGIAYIDLETPYLEYLMNSDINSMEFKKSKKLFLDVLLYAKKARPNVKWGYYYVPFTNYWGRTKEFYNKDERIKEIIQNSDVLFPSIYIFYNNVNFSLENKSYLEENTKEVIRIGKKYNKPVYPMIMSRYHPSNSKIGNELIEKDNIKFYINTILETRYNGKAIDGLMLWNADGYAHRIKEKKITAELSTTKMNFEQYYDQHLIEVLNIMLRNNKK